MFFDQKYFDEMLKELIEKERYCEPEIEALEKLESAAEGLGVAISESGVSETETKEAIDKHPVAVVGLAILEAIQSNASQERYIRLEQMKLQAHQGTLMELLAERLGCIDAKLEAIQASNSDPITTYDVAALCDQLGKTSDDFSSNLHELSKEVYTLHQYLADLVGVLWEKKK